MQLDDIGCEDERLRSNVPNIARRVLGKKTKLHRSQDHSRLFGMIVKATWEEGFYTGLLDVTEEIRKAIKKVELEDDDKAQVP